MGDTRAELARFVEQQTDAALPARGDADLFGELGIDGDDAVEFMDSFMTTFGVDLTNYRWYFHHGEEGLNFGGMIFAPPYKRVKPVPITPDILVEAIRTKQWPLRYPEHVLPKVRWDIHLNQALGLLIIAYVAGPWLWRRLTE